MIKIKDVNKSFITKNGAVDALKNINLEIMPNEIFGIIGLSGAGKSTLVRTLNLLEKPDSGSIFYKDVNIVNLSEHDLRDFRKTVGMIFQNFNLFNSKTVYKNIAYPLEISGMDKASIDCRVNELLALVELEDKINAYPSELSGGQKQRVAIARALANKPNVLLCDEATSALDPKTTLSILNLLKDLQKKLNLTIILITHQMEVIKEICDRVAVMNGGEVLEISTVVDLFSNPKSDTAKSFLKDIPSDYEIISDFSIADTFLNLKFIGSQAHSPIINHLIRKFDIEVNIISGNIRHLSSTNVGDLTIGISGEMKAIEAAISWLENQNIELEVIKNDRTN